MTSNAARAGKNGQVKKAKISGAAAACVVAVDCFTFAEYDFKKKESIKNRHSIDNKKETRLLSVPGRKKLKVWHKIDKK